MKGKLSEKRSMASKPASSSSRFFSFQVFFLLWECSLTGCFAIAASDSLLCGGVMLSHRRKARFLCGWLEFRLDCQHLIHRSQPVGGLRVQGHSLEFGPDPRRHTCLRAVQGSGSSTRTADGATHLAALHPAPTTRSGIYAPSGYK